MLPDYSNIPLQKFVLEWAPEKKATQTYELICNTNKYDFRIDVKNCAPLPLIIKNKRYIHIILGSPIWRDSIDKEKVVFELEKSNFAESLIKKINGEFLLIAIDIEKNTLKIINDRFSSIPIYYAKINDTFLASYAYNDLWLYLKEQNSIELCLKSFYEMIHYRRIFGDKTYDKKSKFLSSASILTLSSKSILKSKYWKPNFKKINLSVNEAGKLLAARIKNSIKRKTSDRKKPGLFLSGGFDTRTILAAFDSKLICFTATYNTKGNREFEVAKLLTELKKDSHFHLQLVDNHFTNIINKAVYQVGGMHQANSIFMGYRNFIKKKVEILFHGHGFDYMFQGMYLPNKHLQIFGHVFSYKFLQKVPKDISTYFINNAPYRVKYPHIDEYILSQHKKTLQNDLKKEIDFLLNDVKGKTSNRYNQLEYISFHALTRHYSFSDHASIHTNAEQRTIAFDNDIFDLFFQLPIKYRFDRVVLRKALKILDKRFFTIYHANTNLPLGSSLYQTIFEFKKKFLKMFKIIPRDEPTDTHLQRTWPTHERIIRNESYINDLAQGIGPNSALSLLGFLDLKKLNREIKKWLDTPINYPKSKEMGDFVWSLITLEIFLRQ